MNFLVLAPQIRSYAHPDSVCIDVRAPLCYSIKVAADVISSSVLAHTIVSIVNVEWAT